MEAAVPSRCVVTQRLRWGALCDDTVKRLRWRLHISQLEFQFLGYPSHELYIWKISKYAKLCFICSRDIMSSHGSAHIWERLMSLTLLTQGHMGPHCAIVCENAAGVCCLQSTYKWMNLWSTHCLSFAVRKALVIATYDIMAKIIGKVKCSSES